MKKSKKNRYAGSQPEERYGLGTRKSLYLDRPTSHGGWPEGEYDPPINDRIFNYLKDMGLVQEEHLRSMIRGILSEVDTYGYLDIPPAPDQKKKPMPRAMKLCREKSIEYNGPNDISSIAKFFGLSMEDFFLSFAESLVTRQIQADILCLFVPMANAPAHSPGTGFEDDPHLVAQEHLNKIHTVLSQIGVLYEPADVLDAILYLYEAYDAKTGSFNKQKLVMAVIALLFAIPIIASIIKDKKILLEPTDQRLGAILVALSGLFKLLERLGIPGIKEARLEFENNIKQDLTTTGVDFSPVLDNKSRRQTIETATEYVKQYNP